MEGETRFSKIGAISESASRAELAALDLKQLFLAMTEEVRIIVVKLADRLHNMRTLGSMPAHKQQKIAKETLLVRLSTHTQPLLGFYIRPPATSAHVGNFPTCTHAKTTHIAFCQPGMSF